MGKKNRIRFIAGASVVVVVLLAILFFLGVFDNKTILGQGRIEYGNLLAEKFKGGTEKLIFVFPGLNYALVTTDEDNMVHGEPGQIIDEMARKGIKIENCLIIIHNHFGLARFSEQDRMTNKFFRRRGFRGVFMLYITSRREFVAPKEQDVLKDSLGDGAIY
jgi:hypothetical protein